MDSFNAAVQEWIPQLVSLDTDFSVKLDIAQRIKRWQDSEESSTVLSVYRRWQRDILHAIEIMILSIEVDSQETIGENQTHIPALVVADCLRKAASDSVDLANEIFSGVIGVLASILETAEGMKSDSEIAVNRERILICLLGCLPVLSKLFLFLQIHLIQNLLLNILFNFYTFRFLLK